MKTISISKYTESRKQKSAAPVTYHTSSIRSSNAYYCPVDDNLGWCRKYGQWVLPDQHGCTDFSSTCLPNSRLTSCVRSPLTEESISIKHFAHTALLTSLAAQPSEAGGIFAQDQHGIIQAFSYDEEAGCGKGAYRPTPGWVISICERWETEGLHFAGFAHSHPDGYDQLSEKDIATATQFLRQNSEFSQLVMAIVSNQCPFFYIVTPDGCAHPVTISIV